MKNWIVTGIVLLVIVALVKRFLAPPVPVYVQQSAEADANRTRGMIATGLTLAAMPLLAMFGRATTQDASPWAPSDSNPAVGFLDEFPDSLEA